MSQAPQVSQSYSVAIIKELECGNRALCSAMTVIPNDTSLDCPLLVSSTHVQDLFPRISLEGFTVLDPVVFLHGSVPLTVTLHVNITNQSRSNRGLV